MSITRVHIYEYTSWWMKDSTAREDQHIALVVAETSGIWYTADIGYIDDKERLEAYGQSLIGKPIDPETMFGNAQATHHLGTNTRFLEETH